MELKVNGATRRIDDEAVAPDMPLLWVLRDVLQLTGTKYGCGVGACGACTVHVDGKAVRSCVTPLASIAGRGITTIEALGTRDVPHALQSAWIAKQVPQCGYCQSGMLMAAAALLQAKPDPSDADIEAAMTNLCRCGTYPRVRDAIRSVAAANRGSTAPPRGRAASAPAKGSGAAQPSSKPASGVPVNPASASAPVKPASAAPPARPAQPSSAGVDRAAAATPAQPALR